MKNAILIFVFFCIVCLAAYWIITGAPAQATEHDYYALATKIVEINEWEDVVTCKDCNGNLWQFYGVEDWEVGDNANLLMDKCGTAEIFDDVICGTSYARWKLMKS